MDKKNKKMSTTKGTPENLGGNYNIKPYTVEVNDDRNNKAIECSPSFENRKEAEEWRDKADEKYKGKGYNIFIWNCNNDW